MTQQKWPDPAKVRPSQWTVDEYQHWVGSICKTPQACSVAGLAGEAGEVAELIGTRASWLQRAAARVVDTLKKFIWHGKPFDRAKLVKELGDTYWYLADLARQNGISMSEVQGTNVDKLMARFPKGYFTPEDSQLRRDEA
jgi:NTP pyrophosphatase (non-canonical NTP hydrolase)